MHQISSITTFSDIDLNHEEKAAQTINNIFKISRTEHDMLYFIRSNNVDFESLKLFIHKTCVKRVHETNTVEFEDITDEEEQNCSDNNNNINLSKTPDEHRRKESISDNIKTALIKTFLKNANKIIQDNTQEINNNETTKLPDSAENTLIDTITTLNDEITIEHRDTNIENVKCRLRTYRKKHLSKKRKRIQLMQCLPYKKWYSQRLIYNPLLPFLINHHLDKRSEVTTIMNENNQKPTQQSTNSPYTNTRPSISSPPHAISNMSAQSSHQADSAGGLFNFTNQSQTSESEDLSEPLHCRFTSPVRRNVLPPIQLQPLENNPCHPSYSPDPSNNYFLGQLHDLNVPSYRNQPPLQDDQNRAPFNIDRVPDTQLQTIHQMQLLFPNNTNYSLTNLDNKFSDSVSQPSMPVFRSPNQLTEPQRQHPEHFMNNFTHSSPVLQPAPLLIGDAYRTSAQQLPAISSARHMHIPPIQDIYRSSAHTSRSYPVLKPSENQFGGMINNQLPENALHHRLSSSIAKSSSDTNRPSRIQITSIQQLRPPNNQIQSVVAHDITPRLNIDRPDLRNLSRLRQDSSPQSPYQVYPRKSSSYPDASMPRSYGNKGQTAPLINSLHPIPTPRNRWPDIQQQIQHSTYHTNRTEVRNTAPHLVREVLNSSYLPQDVPNTHILDVQPINPSSNVRPRRYHMKTDKNQTRRNQNPHSVLSESARYPLTSVRGSSYDAAWGASPQEMPFLPPVWMNPAADQLPYPGGNMRPSLPPTYSNPRQPWMPHRRGWELRRF